MSDTIEGFGIFSGVPYGLSIINTVTTEYKKMETHEAVKTSIFAAEKMEARE